MITRMTEENGLVPVNKGGRPPHEPDERTRAIVESAVAFGITQDDMAAHLGINGDTLRKHYRKELNEGVFKAHMKDASAIRARITSIALTSLVSIGPPSLPTFSCVVVSFQPMRRAA